MSTYEDLVDDAKREAEGKWVLGVYLNAARQAGEYIHHRNCAVRLSSAHLQTCPRPVIMWALEEAAPKLSGKQMLAFAARWE